MIMDEVIKERKDSFKAECNFRTKEKSYFRFDIFLINYLIFLPIR